MALSIRLTNISSHFILNPNIGTKTTKPPYVHQTRPASYLLGAEGLAMLLCGLSGPRPHAYHYYLIHGHQHYSM